MKLLHIFSLVLATTATFAADDKLRVCASIPDLGDLARIVGGAHVDVTIFARGPDDPHFVELKPSFVKTALKADALIEMGMEMEIGWLPPVVQQSGNARIQSGAVGDIDASTAVPLMGIPTGPIDRGMGDVHPGGNPHYLLDPVNGALVARLIRDRFSDLRPAWAKDFAANYDAFAAKVAGALIGSGLAERLGAETVISAASTGKLDQAITEKGGGAALGGWLATMRPFAGAKIVSDHDLWPYFARRFGVQVIATLEPKPGLPPTSRHLAEVITTMKAQGARAIVTAPYFDAKHARVVAEQTGAKVAAMAHQVGSLPDVGDYLGLAAHNVKALAEALKP